MGKVTVEIQVDETLKLQVEKLFEEIGETIDNAFVMFLQRAVREGRIPHEIEVDPFYSEKNMAKLEKAARDMDEYCRLRMSI